MSNFRNSLVSLAVIFSASIALVSLSRLQTEEAELTSTPTPPTSSRTVDEFQACLTDQLKNHPIHPNFLERSSKANQQKMGVAVSTILPLDATGKAFGSQQVHEVIVETVENPTQPSERIYRTSLSFPSGGIKTEGGSGMSRAIVEHHKDQLMVAANCFDSKFEPT